MDFKENFFRYLKKSNSMITSSVVEKTDWKQVINTIGEDQAIQSTKISS